jgi:hypothetical protein
MKTKQCPLCKRDVNELLYDMHIATDELKIKLIKQQFPDWSEKDGICEPCHERFRKMTEVMDRARAVAA